ncbi:MAG: stage II sporulation protein M [Actinomycetota bacterium]|nr:stage II sporulation protein M [Actinomycetota bacterium]MDQ3679801.1 stage II sporulation protein M [Actinomycetota bacterium]
MNLERFLRDRQPHWAELESMVNDTRRRPERLGAAGVRRMGELYRKAAADLALARRRFPLDPAVPALEDLVGRARNLVYDTEARRESLLGFFATGYWRRVKERPALLLVATAVFLGAGGLSFVWAANDPGSAAGLVPPALRLVTEPRAEGGLDLPPGAGAAFSSAIFTNNIRVSFLAFAGGMALGLGTAALLAYNGMILGAFGGLASSSGNGPAVLQLVAPHGVLELSCIIVAGAAGLRLGWAIVEPGHRSRRDAVVTEARRAVETVLGTVPWFILAGLVEGLVTPAGLETGHALGLGVLLALVYWTLVLWRGRHQSPTGGLEPSS